MASAPSASCRLLWPRALERRPAPRGDVLVMVLQPRQAATSTERIPSPAGGTPHVPVKRQLPRGPGTAIRLAEGATPPRPPPGQAVSPQGRDPGRATCQPSGMFRGWAPFPLSPGCAPCSAGTRPGRPGLAEGSRLPRGPGGQRAAHHGAHGVSRGCAHLCTPTSSRAGDALGGSMTRFLMGGLWVLDT